MNGAAAAHADDGEPGDDEPATDAEWYLIRTVDVLAPGVDADNPKITGHVRRLAAGGWTPDLVTRAWLPPGREIRNPTRLALWELGRLKTDPSRQRVLQLREGRASSEVPQCQSCGRWDDKTDEPLGGPPGVWTHSYTAHDGTWSADYCASCIGHEGQAYADDRDEAVTFTHRITGETRIFEPALLDDEPAPARVPWPDEFDPDTQGALAQEGPIHERKIE